MQFVATGLLILMAAIYLAAGFWRARAPWLGPELGYVRAFAEAATIGACADWFAVTALFRRPFGLPIPHTGIIPRNKDRIGEALGDFLANNFLTPAVLEDRLRRLGPARRLADWLTTDGHAETLAGGIAAALPDVVGSGDELRGLVGEVL